MSSPADQILGTEAGQSERQALATRYSAVRSTSEMLCGPLLAEDCCMQTMPDVSPPKWHLAHVSWFFETFLLKPFLAGYREFEPHFAVLFNSYYEGAGAMHPRAQRLRGEDMFDVGKQQFLMLLLVMQTEDHTK